MSQSLQPLRSAGPRQTFKPVVQTPRRARNRSSIPLEVVGVPRKLEYQENTRERLIERFDANADFYDESMEEEEKPSIFKMLEMADIREGESVLDLATGTGIVADYVVNCVGPTGAVIGLDNSAGMLQKAQEKLAMCPEINNLAFIHSAVEDADFQSDSLDVVLCHNGVFYFQDPQFVVNRVFQWLRKPGGRFVFNAQQVPSHPAMPLFQAVLGSNGIRVQEPSLAIGNERSIKSIFAQAGFAGIQVAKEVSTMEYPDVNTYVEDAWQICSDMTEFDLAEEELQSGYHRLRDTFFRAARSPQYQTFELGDEGPILESTHLWVNATT